MDGLTILFLVLVFLVKAWRDAPGVEALGADQEWENWKRRDGAISSPDDPEVPDLLCFWAVEGAMEQRDC